MPAAWVDRDDRVAGNCPAGPVTDAEPAAKLLDSLTFKNGRIQDAAFQSDYLFPPADRPIRNTPGERDGESLIRCANLTDATLLILSQDQVHGTRTAEGYAVAKVEDIRKLTSQHDGSVRLFRVYEDPNDGLPEHAVIRFDPDCKSQWRIARRNLIDLFEKN